MQVEIKYMGPDKAAPESTGKFHQHLTVIPNLSFVLLPLPQSLFLSQGEFFKLLIEGFPGGAVVESLPATAGDTGSSPGLGRSHMPRSNWAREPQLLSLRIWSLCSTT